MTYRVEWIDEDGSEVCFWMVEAASSQAAMTQITQLYPDLPGSELRALNKETKHE